MSTPINLVVHNREHGQFCIEHLPHDVTGEKWDARYVSISGYFGTNGPHVFAAAPELLEALERVELFCTNHSGAAENLTSFEVMGQIHASVQSAIAKARGRA